MAEIGFFEQVGDAVLTAVPAGLGQLNVKAHGFGVKVWFGAPASPTREHYEAQLVRRKHHDGGDGVVLEVGFHAEHRKEPDNQRVLDALTATEKRWRKALGPEATAGPFLGSDVWRRLSEVWVDPDLSEPDAVFDVADRLATYIETIEPIIRR